MRHITHIVLHTAGTPGGNIDQSAKTIREYHMKPVVDGGKGWSDIGYHAVIRFNGSIDLGRPQEKMGAGVMGFNATTYHICCTGNGNIAPWTKEQINILVELVVAKLYEFGLTRVFLENPMRVLGHKECYALPGVPNTHKDCPGKCIDMRAIRLAIIARLTDSHATDFDAED